MISVAAVLFVALPVVSGQAALWYQCGGTGWTGATTCVSGACCTYGGNQWYYQCIPCTSTSSTASKTSTTSVSTSTTSVSTSTTSVSTSTSGAPTSTATPGSYGNFSNPVIYEDFADNDVFLGPDGAYYLSASNMHYSPGAPILRSHDLVNWEFVGHSVPTLAFGDHYNMNGGTAYVEGTWASTLRYRKSTGLWYWYGCIDFWDSYVYTAPSVTGPWTQSGAFWATCFYDCGLFIDDDDTMYIVYGSNNVHVAQLSSDGLSINKTQQVFSTPSQFSGIEGNRMYKRNGTYYVLDDAPSEGGTLIWKSSSPWGPWTEKNLNVGIPGPINPYSTPCQGSLIETPEGDWYFMSFEWTYPSGRLPVLAPITWGSDGFPIFTAVNGDWGETYPAPLPIQTTPSWTGTDTFPGTSLSVSWEWNHNPDTGNYSVNNGLTLSTATLTTDLYHARNTLTHRVYGPLATATILLDTANMLDGDSCGFAAFRDWTAYIGITRNGNQFTISNVQGLLQNATNSWATITDGTTVASASISSGSVWLRGTMQAAASSAHTAWFDYSLDGTTFTPLGTAYTLNQDYRYFIGYRWGIFNFATKTLGGSIHVSSFTQE